MLSVRVLTLLALGATVLQAAALNAPAPKFALENQRKEIRTQSDYKGKVLFVNFWASWCAPCLEELPELNRLAADYKAKKVAVLAINVDPERTEARNLLTKLRLRHPEFEVLWDSKSKAVGAYDIQAMPSSFIIDRKGVVRFTHTGFHPQDPAVWRREIDSLRITR